MFGIGSGAAIFVAQFWGKRDVANIRRVLGVSLITGLSGAILFTIIALVFPAHALGFYSTDPAVIALGSDYLRIIGLAYFAVPITTSFTITLRSTGNVRAPVLISLIAWSLSALLNYALIFGQFGMPALGIHGSAIAMTIARLLECGALVAFAYRTQSVAAAKLRELVAFDRAFLLSILKTMMPVVLNEILWSTGISLYSSIYGRISTEAVAAISIAASVENLAFVPFIAIANSAAIMIGNRIGADEEHQAMIYAKRFLTMNIAFGLVLGAIIFLSADFILRLYQIDATTQQAARNVMTIMALVLWIKVANMALIVGILRAGGDARASALIDVSPLWLVGLPATALGAFVFGLPVYWVYLLTITDEVCKMTIALWRLISKKWIHNLVKVRDWRLEIEP
jgi:putative MATE family efflux protein